MVLLIVAVSCGEQKSDGPTAKEVQAFDSAAPELKEIWEKALQADKTNDFVVAENLLYELIRSGIAPAQREAVTRRLTSVTERLNAGLEKGDPAAKAALDELRRNPPNRPH